MSGRTREATERIVGLFIYLSDEYVHPCMRQVTKFSSERIAKVKQRTENNKKRNSRGGRDNNLQTQPNLSEIVMNR